MSTFSFLPSTYQLFNALSFEWPEPENNKQAEDTYQIYSAVLDWANALYYKLSENVYSEGIWPVDEHVLNALRDALVDQKGNYAGDLIAYTLIRCGCREQATIDAMNLCDSQLLRWRAKGLSAVSLLERCKEAGAAGAPGTADLAKINDWLANPMGALAHYSAGNVTGTLFKGRCFYHSLHYNGEEPNYVGLLKGLLALAQPAISVSNVEQEYLELDYESYESLVQPELDKLSPAGVADKLVPVLYEVVWKVKFAVSGKQYVWYIPGYFAWLNDGLLSLYINNLLEELGHPERVHRFAGNRNESESFWGNYIVTEPTGFVSLCSELGIPLKELYGPANN